MPRLLRREQYLWVWFALVGLTTLVVVGGAGWSPSRGESLSLGQIGVWLLPALFTALGAVIAARAPGNRISLLFLLVGAAMLISIWADQRVTSARPEPAGLADALAVIWFNVGFLIGMMMPICLLMYLFPTGRFRTRRGRWAGWMALGGATTAVFAEAFPSRVSPTTEDWSIANPIGFLEQGRMANPPYLYILALTVIPFVVGGVVAIVVRYRRSPAPVRAQIRWVAYALSLFVVFGVAPALVFGWFDFLPQVVTLMLIPVSVVVSITRYRLFDIDRLISRTIGYALVVGVLAFVYATGAVWIPSRLMGRQPPIFVAVSTLVVAVLFNPVRRRALIWVDRRFNRTRYNAQKVIDGFAARVGAEMP
ncbi:MAG: hypothetical protein WB239_07995, partial [Acidimicrobiia bacterium]